MDSNKEKQRTEQTGKEDEAHFPQPEVCLLQRDITKATRTGAGAQHKPDIRSQVTSQRVIP